MSKYPLTILAYSSVLLATVSIGAVTLNADVSTTKIQTTIATSTPLSASGTQHILKEESEPINKSITPTDVGLFADIDSHYTFQRPEGWNVHTIPSMSYERVENMDARLWDSFTQKERGGYFKIEIVVLPQNGLSLHQWVAKQNTLYPQPTILEQRNIKVAGHRALYQLEQFGSLIHPVIFIEKDNTIYLLNISGTYKKFQKEINTFIENFKFNE